MVRPELLNTTSSPVVAVAPMRIDTELPLASFICEAIVRFQISSYSRSSSPDRPVCLGVVNFSPAGRMASCASCAFLTLLA